jgi:ribosomal protein L15
MRDLIKKLPKLRGHGKNRARTVRTDRVTYVPVNLAALEAAFSAGDTVTPATLLQEGSRLHARRPRSSVKILGTGRAHEGAFVPTYGASAREGAIEKAGGSAPFPMLANFFIRSDLP